MRTTKNKDGRIIIPLVFHDHGQRIVNYDTPWRGACQTAGLPGKIGHDFRRTVVRNMVRASIPERVAMQMAGHNTRSVFDRYPIVSDGNLQEAARRLESAFLGQAMTASRPVDAFRICYECLICSRGDVAQ